MQTETQHALDNIKQSIELLKRHLNLEEAQTRILKIEETSSAVGFWNDQKNAQNLMREKTTLENKIQSINDLENGLNDQLEMLQLANDEQDQELISEIEKAIKNLSVVAGKSKLKLFCRAKRIKIIVLLKFTPVQVVLKHKTGLQCFFECILGGQSREGLK